MPASLHHLSSSPSKTDAAYSETERLVGPKSSEGAFALPLAAGCTPNSKGIAKTNSN